MQNHITYLLSITFLIGLLSCGGEEQPSVDAEAADTGATEPTQVVDTSKGEERTVEMSVIGQRPPEWGEYHFPCSFRTEQENYKKQILLTDMENAGMILNGEPVLLRGGRTDSNDIYYGYSTREYWITLNEKGDDYVFDRKIEYGTDGWEADLRNELIRALLQMDTLPERISMKTNGTVGMGFRGAIGDITLEAIDTIRPSRDELMNAWPFIFHFHNDAYDVRITAQRDGTNELGVVQYKGEMVVKSKDGRGVATERVWGGCAD